ncbi:hypothetical protein, partial [Puniceicoccus vermicola]
LAKKMKSIPHWLRIWIQSALIGEIYPSIRAIAVKFTDSKEFTLRYYLEKEPTDFDRESCSMVMTEILANTSSKEEIKKVKEECFFSDKLLRDIDVLDGLVFARREYEIEK